MRRQMNRFVCYILCEHTAVIMQALEDELGRLNAEKRSADGDLQQRLTQKTREVEELRDHAR